MLAKETKNRLTLFICSILIVFYHSTWVKNSFFINSTHSHLVVAINRLFLILQPDKIIFLFLVSYLGGIVLTEILAFILKNILPHFGMY